VIARTVNRCLIWPYIRPSRRPCRP
jgi:hypothetical protein